MRNKLIELFTTASENKTAIVDFVEPWLSEMDHIPQDAENQYHVYRPDRDSGMLADRDALQILHGPVNDESGRWT